jgi:hypothetical protein
MSVHVKELKELQPWTVNNAPIEIKVKAKRIPNWRIEDGTVQELKRGPIHSSAPIQEIKMIPMGCARIRMTCLPVIGEGRDADEW